MDYVAARKNMVESQLRTNKVVDERVVDAMRAVPRELFAPAPLRGVAYVDEDLPLAVPGRFLTEPMIVARLLQALSLRPTDKALDVCGGSGYTAALLSRIVAHVVAVDPDESLREEAAALAPQFGSAPIIVLPGCPDTGAPAHAPYDAILINGAVGAVDQTFFDQLADGGRLAAVVHAAGDVGRATLYVKSGGAISAKVLFDANAPYLPGAAPKPSFVF